MPAWTAVIQYILLGEKLSFRVYLTLIPIIGGAMMVCKGEVLDMTTHSIHRFMELLSVFSFFLLVVSFPQ